MQDFDVVAEGKAVSLRQFILATFLMNMVAKFVIAPIVMLKTGGRSALPSIIIEQGLEMLEIGLILAAGLILRGFTFQRMLETAYGRVLARIFCGVIALYSLLKVLLLLTFLNSFLSKGFFDGVIWALYCVPVVILLMEFGKRSLRSIGRVSEIFGVFIFVSLILIIILVLKNAEFMRILPLEGSGIKRTIDAYPMWFGDYVPILIFLGRVKTGKHYKKTLVIVGIITFLMVVFSFLIVFASYIDIAHYMDFSKKVSSVTQISVSRFNSGRIDIILYAIQMIAVIIMACQYFFLSARGTEFMLGLKKPSNITSYCLGAIAYVATGFLLSHEGMAFWFFTEAINDAAWIVQLTVPILMILAAVVVRVKNSRRGLGSSSPLVQNDGGDAV